MRGRARATGTAGALVIAMLLTGCGTEERVAQDLESAKRAAQQQQEAIVALLPQELIASLEQPDTGVLMACESEGSAQWTGRATVVLSELPDLEATLESIAAAFEDRGFAARWDQTISGEPRVQLLGADGDSYLVSPWAEELSIDVASASPCFPLADDEHPGLVV